MALKKPVDMAEWSWADQVKKGRDLASAERGGVAFALGDLAMAVEPISREGHSKTGGLDRLAKYAEEIEVPFETLRGYRRVADLWPDGTRVPSVTFEVHRALSGYDDRFELIEDHRTMKAVRELKAARHPKVGVKRDDRWWQAEQESLRQLRTWTEKRIAKLPATEAGRRLPFIRELIEREEQLAAALEARSQSTARL